MREGHVCAKLGQIVGYLSSLRTVGNESITVEADMPFLQLRFTSRAVRIRSFMCMQVRGSAYVFVHTFAFVFVCHV